jgi:hypothetical protein
VAKSPKVIFSACIDGTPRELFSVRQWKGSDLLIVSRHADRFQHPDGSYSLIKDQHYSVHEGSEDPTITSVTQKTEFHDHPHLSFVSVIHGTRPHFLWDIHARRIPHFAEGIRLVKAKVKDTVLEIADFNQMRSTLLYTVFVTRPDFDLQSVSSPFIRYHVAKFDKYQVIVLTTYLNVPNINEGDVFIRTTSFPKVNHEFLPGHLRLHAKSHEAKGILAIHIENMALLRNTMRVRLYQFLGPDATDMEGLEEILQVFSPVPLIE